MKFTRELATDANLIRGYSAEGIRVGERTLTRSFSITADALFADWPPRTVAELAPEHFAQAMDWRPEIIILGTGARQQFPGREIYAAILSRGVGFEVMDTGAASRTFNVLLSEARRVVGVFLL